MSKRAEQFICEVERLPTVRPNGATQEIDQIRRGVVRPVPTVAKRKVQPAERPNCTAEML
jgi:hypothetical protein